MADSLVEEKMKMPECYYTHWHACMLSTVGCDVHMRRDWAKGRLPGLGRE